MSFLYPVFLAGALAIAIPIVLHLLRRDVAPEIPFSAVRLLRKTPLEETRRRRLRDLLLLAARVTALVLLALAFARPYFTGSDREPRLHIVAIDRSYSMGAPGRFERALALAGEAIDSAAGGARVAVIAFDDRAELIAAPGGIGAARASLKGLRAGFGATRYAPVLMRAAELRAGGDARLIVVTDMQRAGWEDEEPVSVADALKVETRDAGSTSSNVAVVGIRRDGGALVATLRNSAVTPASGNARAIVEGREAAAAPFTVAGGASIDLRLHADVPERGSLRVEIDDRAGYPGDNVRYALLDPPARTRVLIVGDDDRSGFYVTRALQAADTENAFDVRVRSAPSLGSVAPAEFSTNGAVLLLSTRSLDRRGRDLLADFVRAGGGLLVAAGASVDPGVLASVMQWPDFSAVEQSAEPAVLAATDLRHPIFRPFGALAANLSQVRFNRAWMVRGEGWDVAARFTDGSPALLERRDGRGRVVVFASDLDRRWNDFPLHPAFVPFAVEAVRHIAATTHRRRDFLVAQAPPEVRPEPGAYKLKGDDRQVTVNVDVRESATVRMSGEQFSAMIQRTERQPVPSIEPRAQQTEARQNLWRYGLFLMLAALVAESIVGRRR